MISTNSLAGTTPGNFLPNGALSEKGPLVEPDVKPIRRMKFNAASAYSLFQLEGDIWKSSNVWADAFANDPLVFHYLLDTPDSNRLNVALYKFSQKILYQLIAWTGIRKRYAFMIDDDAVITSAENSSPPKDIRPDVPWEQWPPTIAQTIFLKFVLTAQQRKRLEDTISKRTEILQRVLGDRLSSVYDVTALFTAPEKQGMGYAHQLMKYITDEADAASRAVILISSDAKNAGFYETCGFTTFDQIVVGEDDPYWDGPAVLIPCMIREPQNKETQKFVADLV